MSRRYTRNHLWVESSDGEARLGISDFLREQVQPVRFVFESTGTEIGAGLPFGRIEGARQACHLYAPFDMSLVETDRENGTVRVAVRGSQSGLLEATDYDAYRATTPR